MTTEQITQLIISIAPSVLAILTMIATVARVLHEFKKVKTQVDEMKSAEWLNNKMGQVIQENYELKKKINELLMKIDHIERK